MNKPTIPPPRHGIPGYYALADLPQPTPLAETAISTGWPEMDKILKIYPGQFVVCTGNAGSGKSTFLFNLITNICHSHKRKAYLYVPENEGNIMRKMQDIYGDAGANFAAFAHTRCFIQSSDYQLYDEEPRTIEWILGQAFHAWEMDKIDMVMIDPWNELERAKLKDELLTDYIGRCLMRIKMFAKHTGCTMFMIAHPTKASVGRDVMLADIEGSMAWFNKCDNGLIVKRNAGDTTVISAKVREQPYAGRLGHCVFLVDEDTGMFREQLNGGQAL